jgi:hypothetical protein
LKSEGSKNRVKSKSSRNSSLKERRDEIKLRKLKNREQSKSEYSLQNREEPDPAIASPAPKMRDRAKEKKNRTMTMWHPSRKTLESKFNASADPNEYFSHRDGDEY